jgi:membrane associated rhomboid family serine protease
MENIGPVTLALIIVNGLISLKGFNDRNFFEKNLFQINKVLVGKEYRRLFVSGFLHADWAHLLFNMISFYSFATAIENFLGPIKFLAIYFASLLGGDVLALIIHSNNPYYRAVGASGAVCGIIFAAIAIFPDIEVALIFVPMPGWVFGIIYALFTIYGIKTNAGNIGHEAHLGGALIGLLTAVILYPHALETNLQTIGLIAAPSLLFIIILIVKPELIIRK